MDYQSMLLIFLLFSPLGIHARGKIGVDGRIKHVVVVMLENRSFDHMLGFLKKKIPQLDGLNGNETNPLDPNDPSKGVVSVNDEAPVVITPDPSHRLPPTSIQIFGNSTERSKAVMDGFVYSYKVNAGAKDDGRDIMRMYSENHVPAISSLAEHFLVMDQWFSGIPGPTQPNRMMFHSATSWGATENNDVFLALGYPQTTIFDSLWEANYTWRDYFSDIPSVLILENMRDPVYIDNYRLIEQFMDDASRGDLPTYSFVEPRWFKFLDWDASDEHPPHPVTDGENFLADVYHAVRNGPAWNNTLMIVTYDEHGGIYDHAPTPLKGIPAPDQHRPVPGDGPPFSFDRLGVRVPTLLISPWVDAAVEHGPSVPGKHYCHSSFAATMKEMFQLDHYLTHRDAWAPHFTHLLSRRTHPRTDTPTSIPRPGTQQSQQHWARFGTSPMRSEDVQRGIQQGLSSNDPLTDLQRDWIRIATGLDPEGTPQRQEAEAKAASLENEHQGALFVQRQMKRWMERIKRERNKRDIV